MRRRGFLATVGSGITGAIAGCIGGNGTGAGETDPAAGTEEPSPTSSDSPTPTAPFEHPGTLDESFTANGNYPPNETPSDGVPPTFSDPPLAPDADVSSFETLDVHGETVRLAPIDVVEAWYRRADARFVDARGVDQYVAAHVYGGVLSTAMRGAEGGPIRDWPTDARVVTYCGCPHHLSSLRAAGLQRAGFSNVFALDEGFGEWFDREYPMAGTRFGDGARSDVSERVIEGRVDPRHASGYAWASVDRQYEAAPIGDDGRFQLHLRFTSVSDETPIRVTTPAFTVTAPLGELTGRTITGT